MTEQDRQRIRAELWTRTYAAVIAHRSGYDLAASEYADKALKAFDQRFKPERG